MTNAEAERFKIEWFHGMTLFFESKVGENFTNDLLGKEADRDEVEYKVFLMLLETAIKVQGDVKNDTLLSLNNWRSLHREDARNNYLTGKFARNDFWDQRKWDTRFEELRQSAERAALIINQIIQEAKAELEDDIINERQTPLMPVSDDDLAECARPLSDMVTLQCENDPEAMARVRRYLEEVGSNPMFPAVRESDFDSKVTTKKTKTIYPPPSVHTDCANSEIAVPKNDAPSIIPSKRKKPEDPEISLSFESGDEED